MTSTASLASLLRAADDVFLIAAMNHRRIAPAGIRDFFDLAEALLSPNSVQECLELLDRHTLAALVALGENRMSPSAIRDTLGLDATDMVRLREFHLVDENSVGVAAWPEVAAQLAQWPQLGLPSASNDDPEPVHEPVSESRRSFADHLAAERAFTAATAIAELLFELDREPARLLSRDTIGNPEKRRLAEVMSVDQSALDTLVNAAELAGLVARSGHRLVLSTDHTAWVGHSAAERWVILAEAWATNLPATVRSVLAKRADTLWGSGLRDWLQWNYPGGRAWLNERVTARLAEADHLGVTAGDIVCSPGAALLDGDHQQAIALLTPAFPAPVDRLYLQHDLSAVAPGPLKSTIDARLRTMAVVDGRAIASRYRFTPASVGRAMVGGETAESILTFFDEVSLNDVPQPVEYLVTETAARHGLLRTGPLPSGESEARSYLRSSNADLLGTVLVDRALTFLDLRRTDSDRLVSRRERNEVYWMLHDASYPVAAENACGSIVGLSRPAVTTRLGRTPPEPTQDPHRTLVQRLRAADATTSDDTDQAWLARELDAAIRSKSAVTVSIRLPSGEIVDYRLEPASVTKGRLRARDPLSEIERTLPLSSIAAVAPAR